MEIFGEAVASYGVLEGDISRIRELNSTAANPRQESGGLAESRYRAIVATAVDGIVVVGRTGAVRSVNNATQRLYGYAAAELIERNVKILMPEPYAGEHDGYLAKLSAHRPEKDHRDRPRGRRPPQGRVDISDGSFRRRGEGRGRGALLGAIGGNAGQAAIGAGVGAIGGQYVVARPAARAPAIESN